MEIRMFLDLMKKIDHDKIALFLFAPPVRYDSQWQRTRHFIEIFYVKKMALLPIKSILRVLLKMNPL